MGNYRIHPFPGSYTDIEEIAAFIFQEFQTVLPQEISKSDFLKEVIKLYGGRVEVSDYPFAIEQESGSLTILPERGFTVYLSPLTTPLRDNFTMAHELGHFILHSKYVEQLEEDISPVVFTRYGSNKIEWQANRFAAAFLMPKEEFIQKAKEFDNDIYRLANYFEVSTSAVEIRLSYIYNP